jgi:F-type H+-transporting ATPase subunit b
MFEIETGLIFWTTVSFGILVGLLYYFALPPIIRFLEKREKLISDSISSAEENRKKGEEILALQKKELGRAGEQAGKILDAARAEGERMKGELITKAEKHADFILEQAKLDIRHEKEEIMSKVRQDTIGLIAAASGRLLGRVVTIKDHKRLIEKSIKEAKR